MSRDQRQYDENGFPFYVRMNLKTGPGAPALSYRAAKARGLPSTSAYFREVLAEAVSRDLGLDLEEVRSKIVTTTRRERSGAMRGNYPWEEVQ